MEHGETCGEYRPAALLDPISAVTVRERAGHGAGQAASILFLLEPYFAGRVAYSC